MVTACFDKIGTSKTFDLTELKPGYDLEAGTIDEIYLDILTPGGTTEVTYEYIDCLPDFEPGWYCDYEPVEVGTCIIEPGRGYWVTAIEGYKFMSAGEVIEKGRAIPLRAGAIGVGNFLARNVDLMEIKPSGFDPSAGTIDEIYADILTPGGTTEVTYEYIDCLPDFEPGWYCDYEPVGEGDCVLAPSDGLWVTAADGYVLEFPDL